MTTMCKTEKGTLQAWSFGNSSYKTETRKGISIGKFGEKAMAILEHDENSGKLTLTVNKKYLRGNDVELRFIDGDWD